MRRASLHRILFGLLAPAAAVAQGVNTLSPELSTKIQAAITDIMARTHVPSASVGIV